MRVGVTEPHKCFVTSDTHEAISGSIDAKYFVKESGISQFS